MSILPLQPEAEEQIQAAERIEQQAGDMLNSSLFDRLIGQETEAAPQERSRALAKRDTLSQLLTSAAGNENMPATMRRAMVNQHFASLGQSIGEKGVDEVYGHIVLDKLERTLAPERIEPLQEQFSNVQMDIIPPEREKAMEIAIEKGFTIPRTAHDIENIGSDHPYFFVEDGKLLVRTDYVDRDIKIMSGVPPLPGEAGKVMAQCRQILVEIKEADPASTVRFMDSQRPERRENVQRAMNSLRMIFGLLFVTLATISLVMERKKPFPTIAAFYAGLAVLTLNPRLFSGPLRTLRGQLEFVHTPEWDALVTDEHNRSALTGDQGADFFRRMTQDSEARMLYSKVRKSKNKMTSEEYYKQLNELGIPEQHITFLKGLEKRNHKQWDFLLYNIQRVQSTDGQELLAGFAQEGMNVDSIADIPTNRIPRAERETYTVAPGVGPTLGGFGTPNENT
jgi:hypothetical protein